MAVKRTWLGWLNIIVLQWLGVRLFREGQWRDKHFETNSFGLYIGIVPGSGWGSDFKGPAWTVHFPRLARHS